jgi:hypothetical protein
MSPLYGKPAKRPAGIVHCIETNVNNIVNIKSIINHQTHTEKRMKIVPSTLFSESVSPASQHLGVYDIVNNIVDT